jgi:hypothetical protein
MAVLSVGSTWNASAIHEVAISMDSESSDWRVPSLREVLRKSMMARASFFLESDMMFVMCRKIGKGGGRR